MVTRLDSAALQTAPWPWWALGGSVPLLTYPHPSTAFGKSCQSHRYWKRPGENGLGSFCSQHCTPPDQTPGYTKESQRKWGQVLDRCCSKVSSGHFLQGSGPNKHLSPGSSSKPAGQRHQSIRDPRRYKLGNGASGCSEDSSPQEGASSPPLSAADPHHSWSPGTASVSSHTPPTIQAAEGLHISG